MDVRSHSPQPVQAYLQKLSPEQIESLRVQNLVWFRRPHTGLAHFMDDALSSEAERRFWNEQNEAEPPIESSYPIVPFETWSDADVGDALEVVTALTYDSDDTDVGDFYDALTVLLVQVASDRLQATGDARNGVPFGLRNLPPMPGGLK